jgi:hypothetical protein
VDAAGDGAALLVHVEEGLHLGLDVLKAPRLVALHLLRVAVHRVAHPGHHLPRLLHRLNQHRQLLAQLGRAHAHDDGQAAGRVLGVEGGDEGHQLAGVHLVGHLDADGVADAAQELDVRVVQLARALAAPQEVAGAAVPEAGGGVLAGQRLLVVHQQALRLGGGRQRGLWAAGRSQAHRRYHALQLAKRYCCCTARC